MRGDEKLEKREVKEQKKVEVIEMLREQTVEEI